MPPLLVSPAELRALKQLLDQAAHHIGGDGARCAQALAAGLRVKRVARRISAHLWEVPGPELARLLTAVGVQLDEKD